MVDSVVRVGASQDEQGGVFFPAPSSLLVSHSKMVDLSRLHDDYRRGYMHEGSE